MTCSVSSEIPNQMKEKKTSPNYKHPHWQQRRLQIMDRDKFKCCLCGDSETTLNVHHRYYVSGRNLWNYPDFALQTLCEECHEKEHQKVKNYPTCVENWELILECLSGGISQGVGKVVYSVAETVNHLIHRHGVAATQAWLERAAFERAGFPDEYLEAHSSQNAPMEARPHGAPPRQDCL